MKIYNSQGAGVVILCIVLSAIGKVHGGAAGADIAQIKGMFLRPPAEYSTGPLWVWNDLLTEQQIRDTLHDLASQRVSQVWVHPRPGLMTPYLSPEWFRLWKLALREAERLDMRIWIYDENSYPSGFAGGQVPERWPDSRGRGLAFAVTNHAPSWTTNLIGVYRLGTTSFDDVTKKVQASETLEETNYLVASEVLSPDTPWNGNRSYVNLLSPGVTEKFLEATLEPYRQQIGGEFGRRVPGVFTDEPNIRPANGWPWSEVLDREFQKRWGKSLQAQLPGLNRAIGDWRRIRYQYFQVLNDQFIEHWSKPYHEYCARWGLQWTGHYWDHDWPNCLSVPDNMAMYAWHQTPAIDCLMNQYQESIDSQFGNVRIVKELSSVANQLGMKRTLCEAYGAGGWDLRFEDMKRIGDWLEVLGVNLIDQHLSYVTIRGARKRDHPQSFSYHEPWWTAYHVPAEYSARLSTALSQGEQINPVLLLEPTTTAWMYQGDEPRLKELGNAFFELLMRLESQQIEYDLGSEDILNRHGSLGAGGLCVGQREYAVVIVPPLMENMTAGTMSLMERFLAAGGKVLACGSSPSRVDGALSPRGTALGQSSQWEPVAVAGLPERLNARGFAIHRAPDDKGILFHNRRHLGEGELLFLANTSLESAAAGSLDSELSGVERWDPYTGKIDRYPFERTARGLTAAFRLEPSGSLLLFLSKRALKPLADQEELVTVIQPESGPVVRRLGENVLTLDYVDVTAGEESRTNVYFYGAGQFIWRKHGQARNPWDNAVQFRDELISKIFPAKSGFQASYKFTIESSVPTNLTIVVERPDLDTITCNGRPVTATGAEWWLDKAFGRIAIASAASLGENIVVIKAAPFTMFHELEPAYVLGDFFLKQADHGFVISQSSDGGARDLQATAQGWNSQGHPFYSAGVAYTETFKVKKRNGRFAVCLPSWYGSVAKVAVNGNVAGYIDAPPWECDATKWIKGGENKLEVTVFGTLKNTLGPHHGNPVLGAAWPNRFQVGPETGPPPGTNYSTVAYGLFKPFLLKQRLR